MCVGPSFSRTPADRVVARRESLMLAPCGFDRERAEAPLFQEQIDVVGAAPSSSWTASPT